MTSHVNPAGSFSLCDRKEEREREIEGESEGEREGRERGRGERAPLLPPVFVCFWPSSLIRSSLSPL